MLRLLIVLAVTLTAKAAPDKCDRRIFDTCLRHIQEITADPNMAFPVSEVMLSILCEKFEDAFNCSSNYMSRCISRQIQEGHTKTMNGAVQVIGDLCQPGEFRQNYLKHARCFKQASIGYDPCALHYQRLEELITAEVKPPHELRSSCCSYSEFIACSTNRMAVVCGEEAAEFVAYYTRRAAGLLIRKHCADFLEDAKCNSSSKGYYGWHLLVICLFLVSICFFAP